MITPPPRTSTTYTLFPYTTVFRSDGGAVELVIEPQNAVNPKSSVNIVVGTVMIVVHKEDMRTASIIPGKSAGIWNWIMHLIQSYEVKRSEEHTSELQYLMRISYAVFCLKKKNQTKSTTNNKQ